MLGVSTIISVSFFKVMRNNAQRTWSLLSWSRWKISNSRIYSTGDSDLLFSLCLTLIVAFVISIWSLIDGALTMSHWYPENVPTLRHSTGADRRFIYRPRPQTLPVRDSPTDEHDEGDFSRPYPLSWPGSSHAAVR